MQLTDQRHHAALPKKIYSPRECAAAAPCCCAAYLHKRSAEFSAGRRKDSANANHQPAAAGVLTLRHQHATVDVEAAVQHPSHMQRSQPLARARAVEAAQTDAGSVTSVQLLPL
jgi:hypothetical protein